MDDALEILLNDGVITYTYDSANRLVGQQSVGNSTSYVYNGRKQGEACGGTGPSRP